jgi:teichuronic acid biosynthesis glycosyltransferase TuaG
MSRRDLTPKISVIVPAYNAAKHIEETLGSICAQTFRNIEVLVVDDCSRDDTADRVRRYASEDSRVRYLRTPRNWGGPAGPRNQGVAEAGTEWIAFCDADDLWDPLKLELQLARVQEERADLICTDVVDFAEGCVRDRLSLESTYLASVSPIGLFQMRIRNRIAMSSTLCRRELIRGLGGFDTDPRLVAVEDYDLWLRMIDTPGVRLARLELPLTHYRRVPTSLSRNKFGQMIKVTRALRRHFERRQQSWLFPVVIPALVLSYVSGWIWVRALGGRM